MNYATSKNEGGISNKGRGLSKVWDVITTAFNANVTEEDLEKLYKVIFVDYFDSLNLDFISNFLFFLNFCKQFDISLSTFFLPQLIFDNFPKVKINLCYRFSF